MSLHARVTIKTNTCTRQRAVGDLSGWPCRERARIRVKTRSDKTRKNFNTRRVQRTRARRGDKNFIPSLTRVSQPENIKEIKQIFFKPSRRTGRLYNYA